MATLKNREDMKRPRANSLRHPTRMTFHVEESVKGKVAILAKMHDRSTDSYLRMLVSEHVKAQEGRGVFGELVEEAELETVEA